MSDIKIDTFRSSVYDKEFSGSETESETIDDFSQYSDQMNNVNLEKSLTDSRSTTPISKAIPIKVNGNGDQIRLHDSLNSSLNEEKDTSEDLMVQISKKTTIKKIISKTTLVNGVTQASEFEELIIHDSHTDGNNNKSKCDKFNKTQTYLDFQDAMNGNYLDEILLDKSNNEKDYCIDETIEATKAHNTLHGKPIYDKTSESSISQTNEKSKAFLLSKENTIEEFQTNTPKNEKEIDNRNSKIKENPNSGKTNENIDQIQHHNLNEKENNRKEEHLITSEPNTTSPMKETNLIETNNTVSILKNDKDIEKSHKIKKNINGFDKNLEIKHNKRHFINFKSQDPYKTDYKFHDRNDHINDKEKFIGYKQREKDIVNKNQHRKYIDKRDHFKSKSLQSKTQFNDANNKKIGIETTVKHMKWVDPFKSYHLKYDLKDNGKLMQHWIRRKQDALHRSNPNNNLENSISKKEIRSRSTNFTKYYSKASPFDKYNSQKDIKEFIIRGNIKENLFQIRHPYPTFTEDEYVFYSPTNKRALEYFNLDDVDFESYGLHTLNRDELKSKQRLSDSQKRTRNDLSNEVSIILNKFEPQDKRMEEKSKSFKDRRNTEEIAYIHRSCCLPVSCCINSCCYTAPCRCLFKKDKILERYKYLSYERLGENVDRESHSTEYYEDSDKTSETDTFIEKDINNQSKICNKIDYLESKLEHIEEKIRNIKSNGEKSVFECAMDLETQCREIEQQLEYLYRVPRSIIEAA